MNVKALTARRDLLPQQNCAPIAEDYKIAELMPCVCLRYGRSSRWQRIAREPTRVLRRAKYDWIQAQIFSQRMVQQEDVWLGNRGRPYGRAELRGQ